MRSIFLLFILLIFMSCQNKFKNGEKHGQWKEYYPNGKVSAIGKYYKGLRNNLWEEFHINGNIKLECNDLLRLE